MSRSGTTSRRIAVLAALAALAPPVIAAGPRGPEVSIAVAPAALAPSHTTRLDLRLTNRRAVPLDVGDITVRIDRVRAPHAGAMRRCTARDFTIVQPHVKRPLPLAPLSTRRLSALGVPAARWPRVRMAHRRTDQDGCRSATLTLSFAATTRAARR